MLEAGGEAASQSEAVRSWLLGFPATASLHNCLSWRPGSSWVALQCDPDLLVVLDLDNSPIKPREVQRILFGKELELAACAWSEDGRFLVTAHAGAMGDLFVHQIDDVQGIKCILQCPIFFWPKDVTVCGGSMQLTIAVAGSPGVLLYTAVPCEDAGLWQAQQVGRLCHMWPVCTLTFGPSGRHLAAAGLGGQLCIWDMRAGGSDPLLQLQVQVPSERVTSMAFSADGTVLAAACWGGAVFLYLQEDGTATATAAGGKKAEALDCDAATEAAPGSQQEGVADAAMAAGLDDVGAEVSVPGNAAAYESRLAAIEHGVGGSGGWTAGGPCLPGQPVKPDLSGPTLLDWAGHDMLLVTRPTGRLSCFKLHGASLVPVAAVQDFSVCQQEPRREQDHQKDGLESSMPAGHGVQDLPPGLRVLSVGMAQGPSQSQTADQGHGNHLTSGSKCVEGLAVMHAAEQRWMVCYDRACTLHFYRLASK